MKSSPPDDLGLDEALLEEVGMDGGGGLRGTFVFFLIVQARTSTLPAVKYVMRPRSSNPVRTTA